MAYLLGEIAVGMVIAALAGFFLGWLLRGIRERMRGSLTNR